MVPSFPDNILTDESVRDNHSHSPQSQRPISPKNTSRLIAAAAIAVPIIWLFGEPATQDRWLAFRDAANYYQPLFAWEGEEWAAGRIPLWNPDDNCGTPALADATSSVFYPGKLIFLLPLGFELRFHLYIILHVVLAAGATYRLARGWNCGREAATLAAVAYALGGNVLFQTCNVVFLIGAAWLPLGVLATDHLLRQRSPVAALGLGVVLALMTLGGDPQMAYHVLLGALLYWAILFWGERAGSLAGTPPVSGPAARRLVNSRFSLLSLAAISGFLLAAVQILPSFSWTTASSRASFERPRSLGEFIGRSFLHDSQAASASSDGLAAPSAIWGVPQAGTHHADAYQFSVPPWRLAEYVWPNLYGAPFPENRCWISVLPGEGRVWTPSMYLGLLPLVLALGCFRLRAACPRQRWLSWSLLLAVLASFGWYGIGWMIHELRCGLAGAAADDFLIGPQVGGLYWLISTVLPGYVYFRYPAKLMVIAALAASLLAATGWDKVWRQPTRLPRILVGLGTASFALAAMARLLKAQCYMWVAAAPADPLFGPLDADQAYVGLLRALLHAALLCLAFSSFMRHAVAAPASGRATMFRRLALVASVCEIVLANGPLLVTVPGQTLRAPARLADAIHTDARSRGSTATPRVYRDAAVSTPRRWQTAVAAERLNEVVTWERDTLLPKHHLTNDIALVESFSTLSSRDFRIFMSVARESGPRLPNAPTAPNHDVLNLLSAQYFVVSRGAGSGTTNSGATNSGTTNSGTTNSGTTNSGATNSGATNSGATNSGATNSGAAPTATRSGTADNRVAVSTTVPLHNPRSFPRAWIVHRVHRMGPLRSTDPRVLRERTREVLQDHGEPRDFSAVAVVESDIDLGLPEADHGTDPAASSGDGVEFCRIVSQTPQRMEIRCRLETAGLVVINDLYYPGWRAFVRRSNPAESAAVPLLRANRIMRSVYLPAGEAVLEVTYRPLDFYVGAAISVLGWLAVLGVAVARRFS